MRVAHAHAALNDLIVVLGVVARVFKVFVKLQQLLRFFLNVLCARVLLLVLLRVLFCQAPLSLLLLFKQAQILFILLALLSLARLARFALAAPRRVASFIAMRGRRARAAAAAAA